MEALPKRMQKTVNFFKEFKEFCMEARAWGLCIHQPRGKPSCISCFRDKVCGCVLFDSVSLSDTWIWLVYVWVWLVWIKEHSDRTNIDIQAALSHTCQTVNQPPMHKLQRRQGICFRKLTAICNSECPRRPCRRIIACLSCIIAGISHWQFVH